MSSPLKDNPVFAKRGRTHYELTDGGAEGFVLVRRMTPERIARVWLWLAHMHDLEAADIHYRWPPDEDDAAAEELQHQLSEACTLQAERVRPGATQELWRDAILTFEDPDFGELDGGPA